MTEENEKDLVGNTDVVKETGYEHPRTTKVTRGINRRIWTAKYEGIEVCSHVEEVIEWKTLKERQQKLDAVTKHMTDDFKKTFTSVLSELGIDRASAWATEDGEPDPVEETKTKKIDSKKINDDLFDSI